jgi:hypothetical protein
MDYNLFSSSSAFEDTVFPYDVNVLSFFDLSRDDDASKTTEYPTFHFFADCSSAPFEGGNGISAMDFASFVLGDVKDEEMSEPDFATSVSSESPPTAIPNTPTSTSQVVDTSVATLDINCPFQLSHDSVLLRFIHL